MTDEMLLYRISSIRGLEQYDLTKYSHVFLDYKYPTTIHWLYRDNMHKSIFYIIKKYKKHYTKNLIMDILDIKEYSMKRFVLSLYFPNFENVYRISGSNQEIYDALLADNVHSVRKQIIAGV